MNRLAQEFCAALDHYELCLHPTDSVPGLTFNPLLPHTIEYLLAFKGRQAEKSFIGLVHDYQAALGYFRPLPEPWPQVLRALWPAPLSVIWQAATHCPAPLVAADGTIALRVPRLSPADQWLLEVLQAVGYPLPTTSVNTSGQPPARTWADTVALLANEAKIFIPKTSDAPADCPSQRQTSTNRPSTLLKIREDGTFDILRAGMVDEQVIRAHFKTREAHEP